MSLEYSARLLGLAQEEMQDRAITYDSPQGEQSMAKTVKAFNALTDHELTEEEGWLFMGLLKKARSTQGAFREDNFIDEAAYATLRAAAARKNSEKQSKGEKSGTITRTY